MPSILLTVVLVGTLAACGSSVPVPEAPQQSSFPGPNRTKSFPETKHQQSDNSPHIDPTPLTLCQTSCSRALDCIQDNAPPAHDLNNYQCEEGVCVFTGCTSDDECQTEGNFLCRDVYNSGTSICEPACTTVSDCNFGTLVTDSDNYSCLEGVCLYTGCNADSECSSLGNYVCRELSPSHKNCVPACDVTADCDFQIAAFDTDNYRCTDGGYCEYSGCNSDAECESYQSGTVCR